MSHSVPRNIINIILTRFLCWSLELLHIVEEVPKTWFWVFRLCHSDLCLLCFFLAGLARSPSSCWHWAGTLDTGVETARTSQRYWFTELRLLLNRLRNGLRIVRVPCAVCLLVSQGARRRVRWQFGPSLIHGGLFRLLGVSCIVICCKWVFVSGTRFGICQHLGWAGFVAVHF